MIQLGSSTSICGLVKKFFTNKKRRGGRFFTATAWGEARQDVWGGLHGRDHLATRRLLEGVFDVAVELRRVVDELEERLLDRVDDAKQVPAAAGPVVLAAIAEIQRHLVGVDVDIHAVLAVDPPRPVRDVDVAGGRQGFGMVE